MKSRKPTESKAEDKMLTGEIKNQIDKIWESLVRMKNY